MRWSLSRLRPVLDSGGIGRLIAEGETLRIDTGTCEVDGRRLRDLADKAGEASTADLESAVTRITGPFLADLASGDAFRFENWRVAEDQELARARAAVFLGLLGRHPGSPESRLRIGHLWAQQDPLDARPHAAVIGALAALGRKREALIHYQRCQRTLGPRTGEAGEALESARAAIGRIGPVTPPEGPDRAQPRPAAAGIEGRRLPLAGRRAELARFAGLLEGREPGRLHLLIGEPGIGKTRLLEEMSERLEAEGWLCLRGRAFEAERARAFGPWIDAVAALPDAPDCPLLRPEAGPENGPSDPDTLHLAMRTWLEGLAAHRPLALILDDVHWLDAASAGLLHYLSRSRPPAFRLMLAGMRSVAAPAGGPMESVVSHWRREGTLALWEIGPLGEDDTAQLLGYAGSRRDPAEVFARSAGHPLSCLAFALHGAAADRPRASLEAMLDERIRLAGEKCLAVLQWSALVGRGMPPALLESLLDLSVHDLLDRLDRLESQGLVRAENGKAGMEYLFGHDLIRDRVRDSLSPPRRERMHAHVAKVLRENPSLAHGWEEIAAHAEAGLQWKPAAEACLEAGWHCSRLYAFPEAESLVLRGLDAAERSEGAWSIIQGLCLLANTVGAALGRFPAGFDARLVRLAGRAREAGATEATVYLLSCLANCRYISDQPAAVTEAVLQVESMGAGIGDPKLRAFTLGDMATCLFATDQDLPRARRLTLEADQICRESGIREGATDASLAMLAHREGRLDDARKYAKRCDQVIAGLDAHLVAHYNHVLAGLVEIEAEDPPAALAHVQTLRGLGDWVKQKADFHFPDAIAAMAKRLLGDPDAQEAFETALERLRAADCKVMTSYMLLFWCEQDLAAGRHAAIEPRCREAILRCEPLGRAWEPSWARALMGLSLLRQGLPGAEEQWQALQPALRSPGSLPARVLRLTEELALGLGRPR